MSTVNVPYMFFCNLYATPAARLIQMNNGCQLVLSYVDANHIKVAYTGGSFIDVILPNLSKTRVTSTGSTKVFSGSAGVFYYVYLSTGNSIVLSTTAPDTTYTSMQTLGSDKVLIGYAALTAPNTMSGNWNVFSYYGQAALTWSTNITNCSTTYATTATMNGFVVPPNKTATITRTGSNTVNIYAYTFYYATYYNQSGTVEIGSWTGPCQYTSGASSYYPNGPFTIAKTHSDMGQGVYNLSNVGLTMTALSSIVMVLRMGGCQNNQDYTGGMADPTSRTDTCVSASGAVTFTRQGS